MESTNGIAPIWCGRAHGKSFFAASLGEFLSRLALSAAPGASSKFGGLLATAYFREFPLPGLAGVRISAKFVLM
jgi:hypothetical protein